MAIGYCEFHKKYLDSKEVKVKRCKCKLNTHKKCRHLKLFKTKVKYRNDTNFFRRWGHVQIRGFNIHIHVFRSIPNNYTFNTHFAHRKRFLQSNPKYSIHRKRRWRLGFQRFSFRLITQITFITVFLFSYILYYYITFLYKEV